jgi:leader peptidase (prepilin peptidase)/N-methyltransferase
MTSMTALIGLPILGLLAGWVVNYLADVLPVAGSIAQPACWNCGTALPWGRSLLFLRCTVCGRWRRPRAAVVELALPVALLYLWLVPAHKLEFPLAALLLAYLLLITVIDLEHRLILYITSIAGLFLGLGIGIHLHGLGVTLAGGAAGYGIMLVFYLLGLLFVRYMSKRRGQPIDEVALGYGDVNLAGIAGLLLGWPGIVFGLLFTILAGGIASLVVITVMLARRRYHAFSAIPYGPFLVLSIVVLLLRP